MSKESSNQRSENEKQAPEEITKIEPGTGIEIEESEYPDELVFAFVNAVGTLAKPIEAHLREELIRYGYAVVHIKVSDLFESQMKLCPGLNLKNESYFDRVWSRMDIGNRLREVTERPDIAARLAIAAIGLDRPIPDAPRTRTAYIISSLKREEEVTLFREVYGPGFFLIAVYAPEEERMLFLQHQEGVLEPEARKLIDRDKSEKKNPNGQRTGDTFALADVFIPDDPNTFKDRLTRFVELVFGCPFHTPTRDEHGMFLAYAASLRSGDLSRQVGAALMTPDGDVLAVGCNDVPRFGGGLYWPGNADQRDHVRGSDSNEKRRDEIIRELLDYLENEDDPGKEDVKEAINQCFDGHSELAEQVGSLPEVLTKLGTFLRNKAPLAFEKAKRVLSDTSLFGLTEFGRTVHAEMDALLTCARTSRSTLGSHLFSTTFPCHNCTRHLVTAGIRRVVYIEPYPKSLAFRLHHDSIVLVERGLDQSTCQNKLAFEPFLGVGPRRFFDLFSMKLSTGRALARKEHRGNGDKTSWERAGARPRVPLDPTSYLDREKRVGSKLSFSIENPELPT